MKQLLTNPVMVKIEISLVEDILKILGSSISTKFTHDEISDVKNYLFSAGKKAVEENKSDEQRKNT